MPPPLIENIVRSLYLLSPDSVDSLDRKNLQHYAKQHGIKANQKNEVLRKKLKTALGFESVSEV